MPPEEYIEVKDKPEDYPSERVNPYISSDYVGRLEQYQPPRTFSGVAGGENPFSNWHVEPTDAQSEAMESIVLLAENLCAGLYRSVAPGPERTLAVRRLMDFVMQANYAITHPPAAR